MNWMILIKWLLFIWGILIGPFLIFRPAQVIKMQQQFYAKINWRMEPIDLTKELRNTRIMGGILVLIGIVSLCLLKK